jgi:heat shock protein HslJ
MGGALVVLAATAAPLVARGQASLGDLAGVTWRLVELDAGEPVPAGVLVTARFDGGLVGGSGGCNRYSAAVASPGSAAMTIEQAVATLMACEEPLMTVEGRYLAALPEVRRFTLGPGRLELGLEGGGRLLFQAGE